MVEDLETLLRINTVLAIVPIIVGVGVTRILARQEELRKNLKQVMEDRAVDAAQIKDAKERIVRLEDLVMKGGNPE